MNDIYEKFNQLNLMVSVEDVFDYIGAELTKQDGFRSTYSCPYHADDLPSLLVDNNTGKFNCFACECGGMGAYSCAKYYLQHTNNAKPTMMMVVNFLAEINPRVEQLKYLFSVRSTREYERGINKRKEFSNRHKVDIYTPAIAVAKKSMTKEQMAIYIDAVMTNMPDEFVVQALALNNKKEEKKGSKEFLSLLGEANEHNL